MFALAMTACGVNSYELPPSVDADVKTSCDVWTEESTVIEPKRLCVVDEWDPSWRVFHVAGYVGTASDGRALVGPVAFHPVYGPIVIAQKPNGACDAVLCNGSDPP